jgi:hypothetical protein
MRSGRHSPRPRKIHAAKRNATATSLCSLAPNYTVHAPIDKAHQGSRTLPAAPDRKTAPEPRGCPAVEAAARFALAWAVMITALASGAFLGLSCGLAPGPLLALLLAQTLRHGPREGCKIALTPLVTTAPIIVVALALAASRSSGPPGGAV